MTEIIDTFESLTAAIAASSLSVNLAELHGELCGVLCVGGIAAADAWLARRLEECDRSDADAIREPLRALQMRTWRALSGSELEFAPLLPADDRQLAERVAALAIWCHGFVEGLTEGGIRVAGAPSAWNDEIDEIVRDFVEISKADLGAEERGDLDDADFSYLELSEFVRVAVQIVFDELGPRPARSGSETLH